MLRTNRGERIKSYYSAGPPVLGIVNPLPSAYRFGGFCRVLGQPSSAIFLAPQAL
jgi:hypothetical protein